MTFMLITIYIKYIKITKKIQVENAKIVLSTITSFLNYEIS